MSVQALDESALEGVDGVAISVPMHTAMRLGVALAERIREVSPQMPLAFYGLYAGVGRADTSIRLGATLLAGEYETGLCRWAEALPRVGSFVADLEVGSFAVPRRAGLPTLEEYARLEWQGEARIAAAVEASHGCRHRCRHCPIPAVYDGRMRIVGADSVLSDIDQLASAGARHVTFGDPDFLNAPRYSLDVLRSAHHRHPHLTFDVTVKVSHILEHEGLWPELAAMGVLFVVSAFESVDPFTLDVLDKNHKVEDMSRAAGVLAAAGIHLRPTWLPFFPWTSLKDVAGIVSFLDEHRLWEATDPVQLSIKLLVPQGSLLETHPALVPHLSGYDPAALSWRWQFEDPEVGLLQKTLDGIAAEASDCGEEAITTLREMRSIIAEVAGLDAGAMPLSGRPVPRLTESWFCCAEPTEGQAVSVGITMGRVTR